jgi:hypothetical protein
VWGLGYMVQGMGITVYGFELWDSYFRFMV